MLFFHSETLQRGEKEVLVTRQQEKNVEMCRNPNMLAPMEPTYASPIRFCFQNQMFYLGFTFDSTKNSQTQHYVAQFRRMQH